MLCKAVFFASALSVAIAGQPALILIQTKAKPHVEAAQLPTDGANPAEMHAYARQILEGAGFAAKNESVLEEAIVSGAIQNFEDLKAFLLSPKFEVVAIKDIKEAAANTEDASTGGDGIFDELTGNTKENSAGSDAASFELTDDGYQRVFAMHDETAMLDFFRRAVEDEGFLVADEEGFKTFAAKTIRGEDGLNFESLRRSLRTETWVRRKLSVAQSEPLSPEGYKAIASKDSDAAMKIFAHRILKNEGFEPKNESELDDIISVYGGLQGNFADLEAQLLSPGFKKLVSTKTGASTADTELTRVAITPGTAQNWTAGALPTLDLTDFGYQRVGAMHKVGQMKQFIIGFVQNEGYTVADEEGLNNFVEMCTSVGRTLTLDSLRRLLRTEAWAKRQKYVAYAAPLSAEGYKEIAARDSNAAMKVFARRILKDAGFEAQIDSALDEVVSAYGGITGNFADLKAELLSPAFQKNELLSPDVNEVITTNVTVEEAN